MAEVHGITVEKKAIGQVLGRPWQRCTVHSCGEALGHARREQLGAGSCEVR